MSIQLEDASRGRVSRTPPASPSRRSSSSAMGGSSRYTFTQNTDKRKNGFVSLSSRVTSEAAPLLGKLAETPRDTEGSNSVGLLAWFAERRWGLQARLAGHPKVAMTLAAMAATFVYASSYFLRFPMLVPVKHNCTYNRTDVFADGAGFGACTCDTTADAHEYDFEYFGNDLLEEENEALQRSIWIGGAQDLGGLGGPSYMYGNSSPPHAHPHEQCIPADPYGKLLNHRGKVWLIMSYATGYMVGKIPSVQVVPSLNPEHRLTFSLVAIMLGFCITAVPFGFVHRDHLEVRMVLVFLGAIPMATLFGVMTQYLEGREATELLNSGLVVVIVLGGPIARAIAQVELDLGLPYEMLTLTTLGLYLPLALVAAVLLDTVPPPSLADIQARARRLPRSFRENVSLWVPFAPGVFAMVLNYMVSTGYRNFKEYFAAEIYRNALGLDPESWHYIVIEVPGAAVTLLFCVWISRIKSHRRALLAIHGVMLVGTFVIALATALYPDKRTGKDPQISGLLYLILIGTGTDLVYAPAGFILYDRLHAATRSKGTTAFLIYTSDVLGQLAACAVLAYREFDEKATKMEELDFFRAGSFGTSGLLTVLILISCAYFSWRLRSTVPSLESGEQLDPGTKGSRTCTCGAVFSNSTALRIHLRDNHLSVPSWHGEPSQIIRSIQALAHDPRNVTRRLSGHISSQSYDHALYKNMAALTLKAQPELKRLFDHCVPNQVSEAVFWWSYFTRVRRIKDGFANRQDPLYNYRPDFSTDAEYSEYIRSTLVEEGEGVRVMATDVVKPDVRQFDCGEYKGVDANGEAIVELTRGAGLQMWNVSIPWHRLELLETPS